MNPHVKFPTADLLIADEKGIRNSLTRSSPYDSVTSADRLSPDRRDSPVEEASPRWTSKSVPTPLASAAC